MAADSIQLIEKRNRAVHQAREIADKYENGAEMSSEDRTVWERAMDDVKTLGKRIEELETLEEAEHRMAQYGADPNQNTPPNRPSLDQPETRTEMQKAMDEYMARSLDITFDDYEYRFPIGSPEHTRSSPEYRELFNAFLRGEDVQQRAGLLTTGSANTLAGSNLKAPVQFVAELIKDLAEVNVMRQICRVVTMNEGEELVWPKRTATANAFSFKANEATAAAADDSQLDFGNVALRPERLDGIIPVSRRLLNIGGGLNVERVVREEAVEQMAEVEEDGFLNGDGSADPLGVFYASASGISTGRDEAGSNTATAIVADTIHDVYYGLNPRDRAKAIWVYHTDAVKMISKLKGTDGQYIWQPAIRAGEPDTIKGRPVLEATQAPNTFTTGQYVGMFGNFRDGYIIRDSTYLEIQRLIEGDYAKKNQIGFLFRRETTGKPVRESAFVRMKLG